MFRLPTEAEWEYVARGWPSIREPAGRFSLPEVDASRPAFTDMRGMVYQWCVDYYSDDAYGSAVRRDPFGPKTGSSRVVRGGTFGCWDDNTCLLPWNRSESSQCAFELGEDDPPLCTCVTGFRLVCVYDRPPVLAVLTMMMRPLLRWRLRIRAAPRLTQWPQLRAVPSLAQRPQIRAARSGGGPTGSSPWNR